MRLFIFLLSFVLAAKGKINDFDQKNDDLV